MLEGAKIIALNLIKIILLIVNLYLIFKLIGIYRKVNRPVLHWSHHSRKFKFKSFLYHIKYTPFIKPLEFAKWLLIDLLRGKDYLRLYGIWCFSGYYGEGKTMGCVQFARMLQRKYPHRRIKIYSNIYVQGQVKQITHWEEILELPPNSIFIYDESQSDWSCNNREFPEDMLRRITQCRKKQFAMFMTSPRFNRMNINIRESVNFVIECKNRFQLDRWFKYTFYRAEDYEQYRENKLKLMTHKYLQFSQVVTDKDYRQYHTTEEVESIKGTDVKVAKKDVFMLDDILKKFRNEVLKEVENKISKSA